VNVEQDPSRLRPSDNPVVLGDPSRIAADTGWRAEIPIERTLRDLLDWWRGQLSGSFTVDP
jgi:GDP-4-dehydro-6-deoxy-D-mannose reductase